MGSFQLEESELRIYCLESSDLGNWCYCNISKNELNKLKENKLSCFDVFNDGRKWY